MPEPLVHIVGPNRLQNQLLASFLKTETGLKCRCGPTLDPAANVDKEQPGTSLVLLDCLGTDPAKLWARLGVGPNSNRSQGFIALFNVDPDNGFEKEALDHGMRGIFYDNEPLERLTKGVLAILSGELWYSRQTLTKCVLEPRTRINLSGGAAAALTPREKEIIMMVVSGARYKNIASELCISPNTVKTHIYNIYKKIDVPNRLQAALWGTQHLEPQKPQALKRY